MKKIFSKFSRELGIFIALFLLMGLFGILNPLYLTPRNLVDILDQTVINGLLALGMTLVIITGGIELSVGSSMAVVLVVVGKLLGLGLNIYIAALVGIGLGAGLGFINGFLVTKMKLQPFIATMGASSVYRGIAYLITGGWPVLNIPQSFRNLFDGDIVGPISSSVVIFIIAMITSSILLKRTRLGTYLYSTGNNEEATRLSGVNVDRTKIWAYVICGIMVALTAMVTLAKLGTGEPAAGQGYETNAIAATAVGGTSLAGGVGSIFGAFLGSILLQALKVGLVVLGVDTFWQYIATGSIIIVAVYFDIIKNKVKFKKLFLKSEGKK
ncbi:ABC transporter permease [Peptoniphilaceae bacterium SGI.131]